MVLDAEFARDILFVYADEVEAFRPGSAATNGNDQDETMRHIAAHPGANTTTRL